METIKTITMIFGAVFAGVSALFMVGTVVVSLWKSYKQRENTMEDEKIKMLVDEIKHININLDAIHNKINKVKDNQTNLIIKFTDEYMKMTHHELICKDRRSKERE